MHSRRTQEDAFILLVKGDKSRLFEDDPIIGVAIAKDSKRGSDPLFPTRSKKPKEDVHENHANGVFKGQVRDYRYPRCARDRKGVRPPRKQLC